MLPDSSIFISPSDGFVLRSWYTSRQRQVPSSLQSTTTSQSPPSKIPTKFGWFLPRVLRRTDIQLLSKSTLHNLLSGDKMRQTNLTLLSKPLTKQARSALPVRKEILLSRFLNRQEALTPPYGLKERMGDSSTDQAELRRDIENYLSDAVLRVLHSATKQELLSWARHHATELVPALSEACQ